MSLINAEICLEIYSHYGKKTVKSAAGSYIWPQTVFHSCVAFTNNGFVLWCEEETPANDNKSLCNYAPGFHHRHHHYYHRHWLLLLLVLLMRLISVYRGGWRQRTKNWWITRRSSVPFQQKSVLSFLPTRSSKLDFHVTNRKSVICQRLNTACLCFVT